MATLGTPEGCPGRDCVTDATGSIAASKAIINFMIYLDSVVTVLFSKRARLLDLGHRHWCGPVPINALSGISGPTGMYS